MKRSFVLAAGLLLAAAAQAQGYLSIAGGPSKYNNDCTGLSACDNNGTAFRLLGGYRMGSGLAFEGLVLNFGKATARDGTVGIDLKAQAVGGGVAFIADLNPSFTMAARLGAASVKMSGTVRSGGLRGSASESSTQVYAGLSGRWNFGAQSFAELNWDTTKGEIGGEEGNISAITIGFGVRF